MLGNVLSKVFGSRNERELKRYRKTVEKINALEDQFSQLSDDELRAKTEEFKLERARAYEHLEKMLDDPGIQIVVLATPHHLHVPQGIAALMTRFGLHVALAYPPGYELLEAPLTAARSRSPGTVPPGAARAIRAAKCLTW